ncbi:unnamed protein product [Brassica oleracea]
MMSCPIPEGYDARRVRPSLEAAFKELGYSVPVSITAYGDHNHTPLQGLSSTGVDVLHVVPGFTYMSSDVSKWDYANPPQTVAIVMVVSDFVDSISHCLVRLLQKNNYNLFLAYSSRPSKMSFLLTSAEWLWESLLAAGPLSHIHFCFNYNPPCTLFYFVFVTFPQVQRKEEYFFRSVAVKVKVVNPPQRCIANCATLVPKALIFSGRISQLMKNMQKK